MKFVSEKKPLVAALTAVGRVVETRNTYPILSHAMLSVDGDQLTIVATDLDIEVTEKVAVQASEPGVVAIPARALSDIVKKAPDGAEISIETVDEHKVLVKYGRSRFNLATLEADSFPSLKSGQFTHSFEMPAADLQRLISKTAFAVSTEETRYYLNGIYLHISAAVDGTHVLRSVATDGHRMARLDVPCPDGAKGMPAMIVPKKTVAEIAKLIDGLETVLIELSDTKLRITAGNTVLLSKAIDGIYPDYDRVTPKQHNKVVRLPRKDLALAIDRVSTMATDRGGKAVKLAFTDGLLTLQVTNQDHGVATEEIEITTDIGEMEIGFNARYLQDLIGQVEDESVEIVMGDASAPALVRDPGDPALLTLCMPMRV